MKKPFERTLLKEQKISFFLLHWILKERLASFYKPLQKNPMEKYNSFYEEKTLEKIETFELHQKLKGRLPLKKKKNHFLKNVEPSTQKIRGSFQKKMDSSKREDEPFQKNKKTGPFHKGEDWKKPFGTNIFFSSLVPRPLLRREHLRDIQSHGQKLLRGYFSYSIESESSLSFALGTNLRFHWIKMNDCAQGSHYILHLILYFLKKRIPFHRIRTAILREIQEVSTISGIQLSYSGRVGGKTNKAIRSRTERIRLGQPSLHVFSAKLDFSGGESRTKFGLAGVKVWIRYKTKEEKELLNDFKL